MLIAYDSLSGNVKRFVNKLGMRNIQINEEIIINEPFVLITYTVGYGEVPDKTKRFLSNNSDKLIGVAASGNRNWGMSFAKSADVISEMYKVPILLKFELSGTKKDVELFLQEVKKLAEQYT